MGKGEGEMWDDGDLDPRQTQPPSYADTIKAETAVRTETAAKPKKGSSCPTCCLKTRDCLMSAECGRALQISSVVAMCGRCIRMWMCESHHPSLNSLASLNQGFLGCIHTFTVTSCQLLLIQPGNLSLFLLIFYVCDILCHL